MFASLRLRTILLAGVLVTACALAGCGDDASRPRVRMAYLPMVASLPAFVAQERGFFREHGVEVELVAFANSNDMVNALIAGEIEVLPAVSTVPLMHLEAQHPGTIRLFSHSRMTPDNAMDSLVVTANSSIDGLPSLAGRKIGVFPGTSARNLLGVFLKERGVDPSGVRFVPLPPPTQLSSLESGAIDALFGYEPITTIATSARQARTLFGSVYCAILNPCPVGASAVSREFERDYPDTAAHAIAALDDAVLWIRSHPREAKPLLDRVAKIPPEIVGLVTLVDVTLSSEVDVENLQDFIRVLQKAGELSAELDARTMVARVGRP